MAGSALPSTDLRYGRVCPSCAGPKSRQAEGCRACYTDRLRSGDHHCPPQSSGEGNSNWRGGSSVQPRGGSRARPQPQSHPWRRENALLFRKRAA
jgi:ribosomal protein L40E